MRFEPVSYPGDPTSFIISWATAGDQLLAGTNDGRILQGRGRDWVSLGAVPVSPDNQQAYGVTSLLRIAGYPELSEICIIRLCYRLRHPPTAKSNCASVSSSGSLAVETAGRAHLPDWGSTQPEETCQRGNAHSCPWKKPDRAGGGGQSSCKKISEPAGEVEGHRNPRQNCCSSEP
jgi:hypothetical protein